MVGVMKQKGDIEAAEIRRRTISRMKGKLTDEARDDIRPGPCFGSSGLSGL